ncbi:MAG: response regulator, partial [Chloroflexota bacterium]
MKYTLLIVEDDPDTSEMLRVYFEAQGYQVVLAATGSEALEQCHDQLPDLILLDVRLPDFDGFEVGKRLQDDLRTSRLPVIFVTERRERDYRIAGLKLGAIDYITKPFDIQELRLRVRNALRRAGSQNNPVTGLPGEKLTGNRLELILERESWAVISLTLKGLSIFNEIYGFVARDDVLRAVALILTSAVDETGTIDDFVGHPIEDRFVVISHVSKLDSLSKHIEDRLNQAMTYFYPIHDREAGYVMRGGVGGHKETVPFMHLSTKKVTHKDQNLDRIDSLLNALALPA